eukprot:1561026-Prymnesium_polylepis.1
MPDGVAMRECLPASGLRQTTRAAHRDARQPTALSFDHSEDALCHVVVGGVRILGVCMRHSLLAPAIGTVLARKLVSYGELRVVHFLERSLALHLQILDRLCAHSRPAVGLVLRIDQLLQSFRIEQVATPAIRREHCFEP